MSDKLKIIISAIISLLITGGIIFAPMEIVIILSSGGLVMTIGMMVFLVLCLIFD
jgi:hypothetical protein